MKTICAIWFMLSVATLATVEPDGDLRFIIIFYSFVLTSFVGSLYMLNKAIKKDSKKSKKVMINKK